MKIIDGQEYILKKDAALYIDVTCWGCKKDAALSNTYSLDGRRFCWKCFGLHIKNIKIEKEK